MMTFAPPAPSPRLAVAVTGHRADHPAFRAHAAAIGAALAGVFDVIERASQQGGAASVTLLALLADGVDQLAARNAVDRDWRLASVLPFGAPLNAAINTWDAALHALAANASMLELSDADERIAQLMAASSDAARDGEAARLYAAEVSRRVALAGKVMIEQADLLVAVWDGTTTAHVGGTGHTMAVALDLGAPVVWIDPRRPDAWQILRAPESLAARDLAGGSERTADELTAEIQSILRPPDLGGAEALAAEHWHPRSNTLAHGYRRIEALFGEEPARRFRSIRQRYETPDAIGSGSGAGLLAAIAELGADDPGLAGRIETSLLRRFAWADGISSRLSDSYRGGMVVNFMLASFAIFAGIAYLPLVAPAWKWPFAATELLLLTSILTITYVGRRHRWHRRWFETRRAAEYLRHSALLHLFGVARAPGRWPRGTETSWPEWYARQAIREVGVPRLRITAAHLRRVLSGPLALHVTSQRDYHFAKARRLKTVNRRLDHFADILFTFAVVSVALYLALKLASAAGLFSAPLLDALSKVFTVLAVVFPAFGSAVAGIRYFGDFERFAAISEITAEKLSAIKARIDLLLTAPDTALDYGRAADLARATDDTVFAEIENWQSVFGGKEITIPV